jgi:hypothetical protein
MRPARTIYLQLMPKLLAMAVALVVGVHFGPPLPYAGASAPSVSSIEPRISTDALKVGERVEPRVSPAPLRDRVPPVPLVRVLRPVASIDARMAAHARTPRVRWDDGHPAIVKHVPRLERGDPPRI